MNLIAPLVLGYALFAGAASAQTAPSPSKPAACQSAEYRQWDFWIGNWESRDKAGVVQGYNLVKPIENGCALQEWWHGTDGLTGTSFSIFDRTRKLWNQTWVSGGGTLLPIEGRLVGKSIVLWGNHVTDTGLPELHRTIWTQNDDGSVLQVWDKSQDGGQRWEIIYEGFLRRTDRPFK
jgi:hypothetical protein